LSGRLALAYRRRSWAAHVVSDEALLDLGPHLCDLARWLTRSEVLRARASVVSHTVAAFELELERGSLELECATDRLHRSDYRVAVEGQRPIRRSGGGLVGAVRGRLRPPRPHQLAGSLAGQLEAFGRVLRGGDPGALASIDDGVAVMAILEAVRRSAASGGWVGVETG
jgi:predicted dehydrogenase